MNRREARELVLHLIFAGEYTGNGGAQLLEDVNEENFQSLESEYDLYKKMPSENQQEYIQRAVTGVMEHLYELDDYIEKYSKGWNIARISRISKPEYVRGAVYGHPRGRFGQRGAGACQAV